jgi:basic amino acid/polyamine antiporter, APA family
VTKDNNSHSNSNTGLARKLGLLGLAATGICSMIGASINVVPFMIHRSVPGIGPYVLPAFMFAAIPAVLAAFAYIILASAMPRAGGSYIYASRGLNPYLGFAASFSQWFGLSIVIGVVSYVVVPFMRDVAVALDWSVVAGALENGIVRLTVSLIFLWTFVVVNIRGIQLYERTLVPLMFMMFALGGIVIVVGFLYNHHDFIAGLLEKEGRTFVESQTTTFNLSTFLSAAALLFSSFIGFDSIAQAGGEARNPSRSLPLAIIIAVVVVGLFYMLFTAAVYHAIPWSFIAQEALIKDITAPGMLTYLIPSGWAIAIVAGAAISLINDLPAMLLSVSRLMFAWAEDGIFPKRVATVHKSLHTPHIALILSGVMATIGIFGCHFAGDFFLGIDIMVTSMLVNFLLMCVTVLTIKRRNPIIAGEIKVVASRNIQLLVAWTGVFFLSGFLIIHIWKDTVAKTDKWYFHSTPVWLLVMGFATLIFLFKYNRLKKSGVNVNSLFSKLPPE